MSSVNRTPTTSKWTNADIGLAMRAARKEVDEHQLADDAVIKMVAKEDRAKVVDVAALAKTYAKNEKRGALKKAAQRANILERVGVSESELLGQTDNDHGGEVESVSAPALDYVAVCERAAQSARYIADDLKSSARMYDDWASFLRENGGTLGREMLDDLARFGRIQRAFSGAKEYEANHVQVAVVIHRALASRSRPKDPAKLWQWLRDALAVELPEVAVVDHPDRTTFEALASACVVGPKRGGAEYWPAVGRFAAAIARAPSSPSGGAVKKASKRR